MLSRKITRGVRKSAQTLSDIKKKRKIESKHPKSDKAFVCFSVKFVLLCLMMH